MSARVLVVEKRTALESYGKSDPIARRLLGAKHPTVARIVPAHESHRATAEAVRGALRSLGVSAKYVQSAKDGERWFPRGRFDLVVTVGGDGTLLAASHHVDAATPILGINSAPRDSVGFFCAATRADARAAIERALAGKMRASMLSRMRVELRGRTVHDRVLNEALFCHACPAATSRYILELDRGRGRAVREEQRSSGFWIGPAAGSTAAQRSAGGRVLPFGSRALQLVVREPYTPSGKLRLEKVLVPERGRLVVLCKMRDARVFLDGVHTEVRCGLGDELVFRRSEESLCVLGLARLRAP